MDFTGSNEALNRRHQLQRIWAQSDAASFDGAADRHQSRQSIARGHTNTVE